ncbi:MAG: DoxX family membrane protein [Actinomycetota bacterium]|nr:DoxX family membrane protein [Actinomycetota bacterium]
MSLRRMAWQLPLRLAAGSFILNSGLSKWGSDEATARNLAGFAAGSYPLLGKLDPQLFVRAVSASEIALGTALLVPLVPAGVAGAGLTAFSAGLVGLYLRTPGMRKEGSLRPTEQGVALAKDSWLVAIGLSLVLDELLNRRK